jgi:hypothetical protein
VTRNRTSWNVNLVPALNIGTRQPLVRLDNYVGHCAVEEDFKGCYSSRGSQRWGVRCRKKKRNAQSGDEITEPWRSKRSLPATCPRRASTNRNFVLQQVKPLLSPQALTGTTYVIKSFTKCKFHISASTLQLYLQQYSDTAKYQGTKRTQTHVKWPNNPTFATL